MGEMEREMGCGSGCEPWKQAHFQLYLHPLPYFAGFSLGFSATGDALRQATTQRPVLWILWWLI